MSQAEDLILVGQVTLLGSRRAFDTLVRKYQGDVRRLLLNLTGGDADLAADIAQDTFLKAWLYMFVQGQIPLPHLALFHCVQRILRLRSLPTPVCPQRFVGM